MKQEKEGVGDGSIDDDLVRLVSAEPREPSAEEAHSWLNLCSELYALVSRQLEETGALAARMTGPGGGHLRAGNMAILEREQRFIKQRLARWTQRLVDDFRPSDGKQD